MVRVKYEDGRLVVSAVAGVVLFVKHLVLEVIHTFRHFRTLRDLPVILQAYFTLAGGAIVHFLLFFFYLLPDMIFLSELLVKLLNQRFVSRRF
jgi:hypothetical protein